MEGRHGMLLALAVPCLAAGAAAASAAQSGVPRGGSPPAEMDLWVCAGQSNMAGAGILTRRSRPDPRLWLFNMDDTWVPAVELTTRLFSARAPAIRDRLIAGFGKDAYEQVAAQEAKKPWGGVGPDLFFARHVVGATRRPIGLVPCALGSTSMADWSPALKHMGDASLYGNMLERAARAARSGGVLKGLLWYQGEGETGPGLQEPFERTWLAFVDSVRRDLGVPDLPVIYVQISRYALDVNGDYAEAWEAIRERQRLAAPKRPNLYVVPAIDLPIDDLIHIGTEGHRRLGRRMAEVALGRVYGLRGRATAIELASVVVEPRVDELHNRLRVRFTGVNGRLRADGRPSGFSLRSAEPFRDGPMVYKVEFDPRDPASVIVWYSKPITKPVRLYYGAGLDPYANIVDSKGMAVPAFGPIVIEPGK